MAAGIVMLIMPRVQAVITAYGWRPATTSWRRSRAWPDRRVGVPRRLRRARPGGGGGRTGSVGGGLGEGLRDRRFWLMFLAMLTINMCFGGILGQLPALLSDAGMAATNIGLAMSLLIGAAMVGRLVEGFLMDRLWPPLVALCTLLVPVGGLLLLLEPTASLPRAALIVALLGFAQGGEASQLSFFIPRYFGFRPTARSMVRSRSASASRWRPAAPCSASSTTARAATTAHCWWRSAGLVVGALSMFATGFGRPLGRPCAAARAAPSA
jgi:hypothetical protein